MEFITTTTTNRVNVPVSMYFDGKCETCGSSSTRIRSSYHREVADLGTPFESRIVDVQMATIECNDCGATFTPGSKLYPPKCEYSLAVITYALSRYYHENVSANVIAHDLKELHGVEVPVDTIYSWIKRLSDEYVQAITAASSRNDAGMDQGVEAGEEAMSDAGGTETKDIKTITIDGTFVTTGVDVVGKKKRAGCLSVTRLQNGTLRLTSYR